MTLCDCDGDASEEEEDVQRRPLLGVSSDGTAESSNARSRWPRIRKHQRFASHRSGLVSAEETPVRALENGSIAEDHVLPVYVLHNMSTR